MKINYVLLIHVLIPSLSHTMDKLVRLENKRSTSEPSIKKPTERSIKLSHSSINQKNNPLSQKKSHSMPKFEFTFEKV